MNARPGELSAAERAAALGPCITCVWVSLALLAAVLASFFGLGIDYRGLFSAESLRSMAKFVAEFFPPDLSTAFVSKTAWAALQTLAVSALGTLLAVLLGAALALPAAGRFGSAAGRFGSAAGRFGSAAVLFGSAARWAARLLLNVLRGVPELVWAALMVLAAGLGPFAGALALALHTSGVLGRLFSEALENTPRDAEGALLNAGSGAAAAFAYGALPMVLPQWLSYALYRWEMNIRMAAVLGFVGAGGLGQMLYYHLSLFQQAQSATVLIAMFVLVVLVDNASARLRRGLAPAYA
jgi:phosphonate transport system permease protein